jgi:hypothetical protein
MSARLVVTGRVRPQFTTLEVNYDWRTGNDPKVIAAGLPPWNPQSQESEPDHDFMRKQRIEQDLADGGEL